MIWNTYAKWIQSYRDLPILINQWANVVRWEMRTRLFLRTAEFLWQEGHTAHATYEEAEEESLTILDIYRRFGEEWMARAGPLRPQERQRDFSRRGPHLYHRGAHAGWTLAPSGDQPPLGQNFAKAFKCQYQSAEGKLEYVYATSWGVSTRLVGTLIMVHSDDKGLVCPPRLAPIQVVIVPMGRDEETRARTFGARHAGRRTAGAGSAGPGGQAGEGIPGFKYNQWELKGVPVRVEVGPRDLDSGTVVLARRDNGEKETVPLAEAAARAAALQDEIQQALYDRALAQREAQTRRVDTWEEFEAAFAGDGGGGFVVAHWDGTPETEEAIADRTKATIRVIPAHPLHPDDNDPGQCVLTGKPSERRVVFAKAY